MSDSAPTTAGPLPDWATFSSLSGAEQAPYLVDDDGSIQCLIDARQYTRLLLDALCAAADRLRTRWPDERFARAVRDLLSTRSAALYFMQPSTRTYVSFALAARSVGMMCEEIRSAASSSLDKGETAIDSLLTLACLADAVIMRQGDHRVIQRFAWEIRRRGMKTRILNGGSGSDQHPTQALLELFTLVSHFGLTERTEPFRLGIVGDLQRSRTARSVAQLLALYPAVEQVFVSPDELRMSEDVTGELDAAGIRWSARDDLPAVLPDLDAVYMQRIQDEYGSTSESLRRSYERFRLTPERAATMKPDAAILHPLPRRDELPIELDDDPRALYWEAVDRGKWARMALLLHMFGRGGDEMLRSLPGGDG